MKYYFIINPLAGEGKSQSRIADEIAKSPNKDDCEIYVTRHSNDATAFVRKTCEAHKGEEMRFIACGGDGTINEVFNGAVGYENVSVSCYPCGSGNDLVKSFGGIEKFLNVQALIDAPTQKLDLLKVGDRYSDNVTNFGFDTKVAETVNLDRAKRGHGSKGSYAKGIVKALFTAMKTKCTIVADGEDLTSDGIITFCTLANGQYVGGSFKCAPRAKTNDGLIEVCIAKPFPKLKIVPLISMYMKGEHLDHLDELDFLVYRQAKKIEITAHQNNFAYSLDGEIIYTNHFTVEIAEGVLDIAVPQ